MLGTIFIVGMFLVLMLPFVLPYVRRVPKPPDPPKPPKPLPKLPKPPPDLPKLPDLRPLDEKVEEQVRIMRAEAQVTRRRRRTAEFLARMAWIQRFNDLNKKEGKE